MAKYVYPAIFTKEENQQYSINFPDFESCYTQGENLMDGFIMASDVLGLTLYDLEEKGIGAPTASDIKSINVDDNSFVSFVTCDTMAYRVAVDNRAVKKTLTIPHWLNVIAENKNVNFSQILQAALKKELDIE